jgi:hypothetical protein
MKNTILILIIFSPLISLGQNITGQITDENSSPLSNVYIVNTVSGEHWHSNNFGKFEITDFSGTDTLVFSYLGFEKVILTMSDSLMKQELIIKMKPKSIELSEISVSGHLKSLNIVSEIDLHVKPVNTSQEILRTVPGLIIGQHAGGGKAEQIFLRGFDIDHGTDINITVDGLPVNMVSHAHGQGYADLHFLIPEIIEKIDFGKGTYYADKGNFNTSGYVDFKTKDKLTENQASVEYGSFNTIRTSTLLNLINSNKQSAYFAGEFLLTDGAFETSQNFNRINLFGKYIINVNQYDKIMLLSSYFTSKWDASGQIPQRAVDVGLINRFGAIDNTEGGNTSRINLCLNYLKFIDNQTFVKNQIFYSAYDFELYSNFTFFLNDPVNGDQIKQKEKRNIFGAESELTRIYNIGITEIKLKTAVGFRHDIIDNIELSHTKDREITLEKIKFGDINESNLYGYINTEFDCKKWLINPAIRFDFFKFNYVDKLARKYKSSSVNKATVSPKLNILYNQSEKLQFFLKSGIGFHSNDTRVVIPENGRDILPAAFGADLGTIIKPGNRIILNASIWYLYLKQEFVYVGDEGVVEPTGKTRRTGIDFGLRYQLTKKIFINNDINYAFARSIAEPEGKNYIPLAPDLTSTGGLSIVNIHGFSGGIRYRYLRNRPANEDNSIVAKGYLIADMNLSYSYKSIELGLIIENLFNSKWNETQFATETRLQNEAESVEEIHFIPGTPFFIKSKLMIKF